PPFLRPIPRPRGIQEHCPRSPPRPWRAGERSRPPAPGVRGPVRPDRLGEKLRDPGEEAHLCHLQPGTEGGWPGAQGEGTRVVVLCARPRVRKRGECAAG